MFSSPFLVFLCTEGALCGGSFSHLNRFPFYRFLNRVNTKLTLSDFVFAESLKTDLLKTAAVSKNTNEVQNALVKLSVKLSCRGGG